MNPPLWPGMPETVTHDPDYRAAMTDEILCERLRFRYDFEYWCRKCVVIKDKTTGCDVCLRLNKPQRRIAAMLEEDRIAGRPLRLIMLKSRQWGGSTLVQFYMAWLQLCHCRNWHSIIASQVKDTSATIRGMYTKLLDNYPVDLWEGDEKPRFRPFERSRNVREIQGRGCRVTISSIENQDAVRGADFAMAHLSEVAFWRPSPTHSPEDMVRAVCSSVALAPNTLIVMESTANGVGNYFHNEWLRCSAGLGDKRPVFVPWYEIDFYRLPVADEARFMAALTPYETILHEKFGCEPDQINWYRHKLREYPSHRQMMAEFPTTPEEAFANTGSSLFGAEHVEALRADCRPPIAVGEVSIESTGDEPVFSEDSAGRLKIWAMPRKDADYSVSLDIGGLTDRADWSVISVMRTDTGVPEVVAQWRGHIEHDILAKTACKIGMMYNEALLILESNSLEHSGAGQYILNNLAVSYPRMYSRRTSRPGFHTNISTKEMIITGLMAAVREHAYIERDADACNEMLSYEQAPDGRYAAKPGAHDDILMTRAMTLFVLREIAPVYVPVPKPPRRVRRALARPSPRRR